MPTNKKPWKPPGTEQLRLPNHDGVKASFKKQRKRSKLPQPFPYGHFKTSAGAFFERLIDGGAEQLQHSAFIPVGAAFPLPSLPAGRSEPVPLPPGAGKRKWSSGEAEIAAGAAAASPGSTGGEPAVEERRQRQSKSGGAEGEPGRGLRAGPGSAG